MTQEEKAKRYDEAIKKAGERYNEEYTSTLERSTLVYVFPELKESEDKRIRKWIIGVLSTYEHDKDLRNAAIAWLEKQGEQKPIIEMITPEESLGIDSDTYNKIVDECIYGEQKSAWSEKDSPYYDDICEILINLLHSETANVNKDVVQKDLDWLKSLKDRIQPQPKQEWDEEDETKIKIIIALLKSPALCCMESNKGIIDASIKYLKSLKGRYTFKPSDEQIEALESATENCAYSEYQDCLRELIEQLKKLSEE